MKQSTPNVNVFLFQQSLTAILALWIMAKFVSILVLDFPIQSSVHALMVTSCTVIDTNVLVSVYIYLH